MRVNLQVFVVCGLLFASVYGAKALDPRWKLIFSDEFDQDKLDTAKWTARKQAGFHDEKEYYHPSFVSVKNGNLVIKSDRNNSFDSDYKYASGYVDTANKFSTSYGRYEVRAKLPHGKGIWPAHWLLADSLCWPVGAEIDIMEAVSQGGQIHGTYHYASVCGDNDGNGTMCDTKLDLEDDYHVYAIEWDSDHITWFFDDKAYHSVYSTSLDHGKPFDVDGSPHYIILNTAVGGSWPGSPDNTTVFPQYHYIDYVRVYVWEPCKTGCVHGCCDSNTSFCECDFGYYGTLCDYLYGANYANKFVTKQSSDSVSGNYAIDNGLTLTVQGSPLTGGQWTFPTPFSFGNFTFTLKGNKVSGTGLLLLGTSSTGTYQGFQLGVLQNSVTFQSWGAKPYGFTSIDTKFDTTTAYHEYTVSYSNVFKVYVDDKLILTTNWAPTVALQMSVQYQYGPSYFGPWTATPPVSVNIRNVSWTQETHKAKCLSPSTTSTGTPGTTATTGQSPSTSSPSSSTSTSGDVDSMSSALEVLTLSVVLGVAAAMLL